MRRNKGITLVALIITIVIMLILVAVSVNVLIKSNLIGTAEKAVNKYKTAAEEESNLGGIVINGIRYGAIEDYAKGGAAKLDNVKYQTLQEAIDKVPADNTEKTITVLRDIYENTKIPENKNIILDLDNNTIMYNETSKPVMEIDGKVTISNGTVKGKGLTEPSTIKTNKNSELTIINSNIEETSSGATIELYGELNMKSGKVTSSISNGIYGDGKLIVEGGEITSTGYPAIYMLSDSETIIKKGKVFSTSNVVVTFGRLTIEGGEFNGNESLAPAIYIDSNSETIIKGGKIFSASNAVQSFGKLTIEGGEFISTGENYPTIYIKSNSEATINNGKFNSERCITIYNNAGKLTVNDGEFRSNSIKKWPTIALASNSETIIKGGKITAQNYIPVYNKSNATLTISGGTITGKNNCVVANEGVLKFDGGTIEYTGDIKEMNSTSGSFALNNSGGGTAEINGGIIRSSATALRENSGTVTISGGEIYGKNMAIEILGGTLNINNGTIESTENSAGTSMALNMSNNCIVNFNGGTLKTIDSMKLGSGSTFNYYGGTITKTGTAGENFTGEGTYNDKR